MKYLTIPVLNFLGSDLQVFGLDGKILFNFEGFSCKMIKRDKRDWKNVADKEAYLKLSDPCCFDKNSQLDLTYMNSGFTQFFHTVDIYEYIRNKDKPPIKVDRSVRPKTYWIQPKLLCNLSSGMKYLLEDWDYDLTSSNFSFEPSIQGVINYVDSIVLTLAHSYCQTTRNKLWSVLNSYYL
ncbi:hypothetical protein HZS_7606 [Henneguya salminicola]|nr:hypothetical protein HZS_7606 [Henneguya salminicola]